MRKILLASSVLVAAHDAARRTEEERWRDLDRYAAITAALLAYADKLDCGVQLMNSPNATAAR
jgi:hypothetical protein